MIEDGAVGFAIQKKKGRFTRPDTWLPTMRCDHPLALRRGYRIYGPENGYQDNYKATSWWAEGQLLVPLVPGVMANLLSWIQDRDSHNQGRWGSLLVDRAGELLKVRNAKVRRASFYLSPGRPIMCALDVAGVHAEPATSANSVMPTTAPYIYSEAEVELASGGGALGPADCGKVSITVDNSLEDCMPELPMTFENRAGVRVRGTISREFTQSSIYADFAAGEEAAMTVQLQRGANVLHMALPRILYTTRDVATISHCPFSYYPLPVTHYAEQVTFIGLSSCDGVTPPIVLAELPERDPWN